MDGLEKWCKEHLQSERGRVYRSFEISMGGLVLSFDLRRPYLGHKDSMFAVRHYIGDGTATSFK